MSELLDEASRPPVQSTLRRDRRCRTPRESEGAPEGPS